MLTTYKGPVDFDRTLSPEGTLQMPKAPNRVCAVVVTFNRCALLRRCLEALQSQSHVPDSILIVNNASTDGTEEMLCQEFSQLPVLRLEQNMGGAGGFHAGMKQAYEEGYDWLWLMDDDGVPAPDCLENLLEHAAPNRVLVPIQQESHGRTYGVGEWRNIFVDVTPQIMQDGAVVHGEFLFAFVGPLISRGAVEQTGLPNKDFFIWFDDYEYAMRLARQRLPVTVVPHALFQHDLGGVTREVRLLGRRGLRNNQPAWKTYYGTRNHLYTVLRTRRSPRELGWFFIHQTWLLLGDVVHEKDRRMRAGMRGRGVRDGILGRMGKRV
jgi:rhamnopyranosyl-N-acetylglucosaminyl-diphospho-decaprenol beta-1,3/1,4-galactofuranosyltransferase